MNAVIEWLDAREPAPPLELQEWLAVPDRGLSVVEALVEGGAEALEQALERPGRDRDAAFYLLAADALLTYACEATVEGDGDLIEQRLADILTRTGTRT